MFKQLITRKTTTTGPRARTDRRREPAPMPRMRWYS
jgi:hypothetical protein